MHTSFRFSVLFSSITALALAGCVPQTPPPGGVTSGDGASSSITSSAASSVVAMMAPEHIAMADDEMTWSDAPPVIPAGAKVAVLEGDPSKPGPFTLRFQFPANYRIAPHSHPADEHVTVLSGDFAIGLGDTFSETALDDLGAGGFAMMKAGLRHFARSRNGAVIQLHGIGPWGLTYVNPADDPRTAASSSSSSTAQ